MPIDHLKKGDWESCKESVGELNKELYSELKKAVKFLRIVDSYLLSSKSIDKYLGSAILLCIFSVLLFIAYEFSLNNFQTSLLPLIPILLIQISMSYIFLKEELALTSWNTLIKLPNFVLYKICEYFVFLLIFCIKDSSKVIKFLRITCSKAYTVSIISTAVNSMFYYYCKDIQFDNLLTVILLIISLFTITSIACTLVLNSYEDNFNKLIIGKISIFCISFLCCIGTLKCLLGANELLLLVHGVITTIVIVACYSLYEIFK